MIAALLALLLAYLPFQIAINPATNIDLSSARLFIVCFFLLFLVHSLVKKKLAIPVTFSAISLYCFLFFAVFSIIFSNHMDWSLRKLAFLFSIFPIYIITSSLWKKSETKLLLLNALVIGATLSAFLGFVQFSLQFIFGIDKALSIWSKIIIPFLGNSFGQAVLEYPSWLVNIGGLTYFRLISVFPDPHMYAFYLGMTVPIAISLYFELKNKWYLLSACLLAFADLLTFSRGGYLAIFLTVLLLFFFSSKQRSKKYAYAFLSTITAILILFSFSNPVSERFVSMFNLQDGSNQGRLALWKSAGAIIKSNIFGVGIGNFSASINPLAQYRDPIYAHSTYLDIAAEIGIAGALAWISFLGSLIFAFRKKAKQNAIYAGALVSILIFSIHSLVETPIFSVHVFSLLLVISSLDYEKS